MTLGKSVPARFAATLLAGLAGGLAFAVAGLPAPFLSGAMVGVAALALSGFAPHMPNRLRDVVYVLLGVSMGAGVTPEALAGIAAWPLSLLALGACIAAIVVAVMAYLCRVAGWDRSTAYFAGMPGALPMVLALSLQSQADTRRIAVAQSLRLFILVACLPSIVVMLGSDEPGGVSPTMLGGLDLREGALLLAVGTAGGIACQLIRLPAGLLVGAMFASGALYATGSVTGFLPPFILVPSFVVIGAVIGARFAGTTLSELRRILGPALGAFVISVVVAGAFAGLVSWGLAIPLDQTLLAFAPGGVETMTLLAFLLGVDPAYVGTHHIARFIGLSLILPLWARSYMRAPGPVVADLR